MQQALPAQTQRTMQRLQKKATHKPSQAKAIALHLPRFRSHHLGLLGVLIILLIGWQSMITVGNYKPFILPSPIDVVERLIAVLQGGMLWVHIAATLQVALGGFAGALTIAIVLGYLLAHMPYLERVIAPILAASQAIPVLAVAPLIILWFGTGLNSKILVAMLITFFPMLLTTIAALRNVPKELQEMALISGANRWQVLWHVEIPLSLPVFFSGVRTGLSLATTGAVVAEFVAGREGLGAMINIARGLFDTPLIFVALIILASITLTFYLLASLIERIVVHWEE